MSQSALIATLRDAARRADDPYVKALAQFCLSQSGHSFEEPVTELPAGPATPFPAELVQESESTLGPSDLQVDDPPVTSEETVQPLEEPTIQQPELSSPEVTLEPPSAPEISLVPESEPSSTITPEPSPDLSLDMDPEPDPQV